MKKQTVFKLLAVALTAAVAMSTAALPTFAAIPTLPAQISSLRQSSSNGITYTLDVTGETGTVHLDGSDADKVIDIEQGSRLFITLPSNVGANVGSSDVGTVNPIKRTSAGYDLNVIPWGTVGSKTGMFFNGVKLFTINTAAPTGGWKDDAVPVVHLKGANAKYAFSVTVPNIYSVSVNTGNGKIGTIDMYWQDDVRRNDLPNLDGTITYYFSARAMWNSCSFGVYAHVGGTQYEIFRCVIDGSQTPTHTYSIPSPVSTNVDFHGARWGTTDDYEYNETIRMAKEWLNSSTTQENIRARIQQLTDAENDGDSGWFERRTNVPFTPAAVRLLAIDYAITSDFGGDMVYTDGSAYRVLKNKFTGGCYDIALLHQVIYQLAGYDCKLAWGSAGDPNCEGDNHITAKVCVDGKWYYSNAKFETDPSKIFTVVWGEGYNE